MTGSAPRHELLTKGGVRAGQALVLTKAVGTGKGVRVLGCGGACGCSVGVWCRVSLPVCMVVSLYQDVIGYYWSELPGCCARQAPSWRRRCGAARGGGGSRAPWRPCCRATVRRGCSDGGWWVGQADQIIVDLYLHKLIPLITTSYLPPHLTLVRFAHIHHPHAQAPPCPCFGRTAPLPAPTSPALGCWGTSRRWGAPAGCGAGCGAVRCGVGCVRCA